jgi:hypothetical protein
MIKLDIMVTTLLQIKVWQFSESITVYLNIKALIFRLTFWREPRTDTQLGFMAETSWIV